MKTITAFLFFLALPLLADEPVRDDFWEKVRAAAQGNAQARAAVRGRDVFKETKDRYASFDSGHLMTLLWALSEDDGAGRVVIFADSTRPYDLARANKIRLGPSLEADLKTVEGAEKMLRDGKATPDLVREMERVQDILRRARDADRNRQMLVSVKDVSPEKKTETFTLGKDGKLRPAKPEDTPVFPPFEAPKRFLPKDAHD